MLLFNKFSLLAFDARGVHEDHLEKHIHLRVFFVLCGKITCKALQCHLIKTNCQLQFTNKT